MLKLKYDLLSRGFVASEKNDMIMEYAFGSISNYTKCRICLNIPHTSEMSKELFYLVHLESFVETGDPAIDYHDITDRYIAESEIPAYLKKHGILSKEEREARRQEFQKRLEEAKRRRAMR